MVSQLPHVEYELGTPKAQFKVKNGRYIWRGVSGILVAMVMVCVSWNMLMAEEGNGVCLCGWGLGIFGFGLLSSLNVAIAHSWRQSFNKFKIRKFFWSMGGRLTEQRIGQ
jgi:hypothetical protein